jgi:hypothetical protein
MEWRRARLCPAGRVREEGSWWWGAASRRAAGGVQKGSPQQLGEGDAHEAGEGLARRRLRLMVDAIAPAAPLVPSLLRPRTLRMLGARLGRIVRPLMGVGFRATARDSLEVELERRQAGERGEERRAPVVADAVPSARPAAPESAVGCARTDRAIQTRGWGGAGQGVPNCVFSKSTN